jgi:hypothetical protein
MLRPLAQRVVGWFTRLTKYPPHIGDAHLRMSERMMKKVEFAAGDVDSSALMVCEAFVAT